MSKYKIIYVDEELHGQLKKLAKVRASTMRGVIKQLLVDYTKQAK